LTQQHTIKNPISCSGVGLHSGANISLTLKPAAANSGIVFVRTDLDASAADCLISARWDNVSDTTMCTTLSNAAGAKVATVEHLMAALAGCGVDNLLVEVDGPEVPIMDGSSAPFVFLVECAGLLPQGAPRRAIRVLKQVEIWHEDSRVALVPSEGFSVSFEIEFDTAAIENNDGFFDLHNGGFKREICRARTFGFESDVQRLMELGLARGGSLDNAVVIGNDDQILNEGGLRYGDEFVRHKVLDCVGDLYLSGGPMLGHFAGFRSGHTLNNGLLRKLFEDRDAWEYCETMPRASDEPSVSWRHARHKVAATALVTNG
jgi:UDP-3-O-[3-hydroxymyristoyl] N-acetylglucosamine deacetylase